MSPLARRYRRLLLAYPRDYRLGGCLTAAAGLAFATLPHTQVRRAGSYPGTTTAPVRRP